MSFDKKECIDEDECGRSGVCLNGQCSNIDGGFRCVCNEGFQLSPDGLSCRDVDECAENPFVCLHGRCRNTQGTYVCECQPGYAHSATGGYCMDENECTLLNNACGNNGRCVNTEGSYRFVVAKKDHF